LGSFLKKKKKRIKRAGLEVNKRSVQHKEVLHLKRRRRKRRSRKSCIIKSWYLSQRFLHACTTPSTTSDSKPTGQPVLMRTQRTQMGTQIIPNILLSLALKKRTNHKLSFLPMRPSHCPARRRASIGCW
jgi:hypothetical protein